MLPLWHFLGEKCTRWQEHELQFWKNENWSFHLKLCVTMVLHRWLFIVGFPTHSTHPWWKNCDISHLIVLTFGEIPWSVTSIFQNDCSILFSPASVLITLLLGKFNLGCVPQRQGLARIVFFPRSVFWAVCCAHAHLTLCRPTPL